jgi:hypothetical protein
MSRGWTYKPGDWNIHCDVCSKKIKASEAKHRWDGFIVCADDYEERHPLDFVRTVPDNIRVPFIRKQADDQFLVSSCTIWTSSGYVGFGSVGCMVVGNDTYTVQQLGN